MKKDKTRVYSSGLAASVSGMALGTLQKHAQRYGAFPEVYRGARPARWSDIDICQARLIAELTRHSLPAQDAAWVAFGPNSLFIWLAFEALLYNKNTNAAYLAFARTAPDAQAPFEVVFLRDGDVAIGNVIRAISSPVTVIDLSAIAQHVRFQVTGLEASS